MFHLVLFEPEIAGNVGNIARTCLATGSKLHLIRPLGFRLSDEALKRAGMDYWQDVEVITHSSFSAFAAGFKQAFLEQRVFMLSTKASTLYHQQTFQPEDVFLFGPESRGLPEAIRQQGQPLRIPMLAGARSLNLSVSVAVVVYEAWRQNAFRS
jgi:tRNA (cytidine/uridine-2'-O-)-methyltransferase